MSQVVNANPSSGSVTDSSSFSGSFPAIPSPGPGGTYQVTVNLQTAEAEDFPVIVTLMQGSMVIASVPATVTASPQDVVLTLSPSQIQRSRCDLSGLTVVVGPSLITIPCCSNPIPAALTGTFSAPGCGQLDGVVVNLLYDHSTGVGYWLGLSTPRLCGSETFGVTFRCSGSDSSGLGCSFSAGLCAGPGVIIGTPTCSPLSVVFRVADLGIACPCCSGKPVTLTITEPE